MNPDQHDEYRPYRAPAAPVQSAEAAAFPPLGTTLSTYTPGYTAAPGLVVVSGQKPNWKKWLKRLFITLLVVLLLAGGYVGAKFLINASKTFGGNLFGLLQNDKLQGEDVGRVNILVAGNSADDVGHSGGDLTDSVMIVSLDTKNNTAFLLSVPRDLWVSIPGHGHAKVNSTYVYGKADKFSESGYPNGGMGLLEKVIERDFGIDINYYGLVNYGALREGGKCSWRDRS